MKLQTIFAIAPVLLAPTLLDADQYEFHAITMPAGVTGKSNTSAINASNMATGSVFHSNDEQSFIWDPTNGTQWINYSSEFLANDINNSGQVAAILGSAYNWDAVIWQNGSLQNLGKVTGSNETSAAAINNLGVVVGSYNNPNTKPMIGDIASGALKLDDDFDPYQLAYAQDINDAGKIVGTIYNSGAWAAYSWENGVVTWLPGLGGNIYANGLNQPGQIVGGTNGRPVIWNGSQITDLGSLGGSDGRAIGINDLGQAVGYSQDASGTSRAFLWKNGQIYDLNSLVNLPAGWTLASASDINDQGSIVGYGIYTSRH